MYLPEVVGYQYEYHRFIIGRSKRYHQHTHSLEIMSTVNLLPTFNTSYLPMIF